MCCVTFSVGRVLRYCVMLCFRFIALLCCIVFVFIVAVCCYQDPVVVQTEEQVHWEGGSPPWFLCPLQWGISV